MIKIEKDIFKMQYIVRIDKKELDQILTQNDFNDFISRISKLIYEEIRKT